MAVTQTQELSTKSKTMDNSFTKQHIEFFFIGFILHLGRELKNGELTAGMEIQGKGHDMGEALLHITRPEKEEE